MSSGSTALVSTLQNHTHRCNFVILQKISVVYAYGNKNLKFLETRMFFLFGLCTCHKKIELGLSFACKNAV